MSQDLAPTQRHLRYWLSYPILSAIPGAVFMGFSLGDWYKNLLGQQSLYQLLTYAAVFDWRTALTLTRSAPRECLQTSNLALMFNSLIAVCASEQQHLCSY